MDFQWWVVITGHPLKDGVFGILAVSKVNQAMFVECKQRTVGKSNKTRHKTRGKDTARALHSLGDYRTYWLLNSS
jgi:hypothetical protein